METITSSVERAHEVLGLTVFAEMKQINNAFRRRALQCHPDIGGSAERFREIRDAAEYLSDPEVRDSYESELRRTTTPETTIPTPTPTANATQSTRPSAPVRQRIHRHTSLLAAAIFGYFIAPHFRELGLTWSPTPFHDFCQLMQSLDWVFLATWWWIRKPTTEPGPTR